MPPLLLALLTMLGIPAVTGSMDLLKMLGEGAMFEKQKKFAKEMQAREAETLAMVSGRNVAHQNDMFKKMQGIQDQERMASREDQMAQFMLNQALMGQQQAGQIAQTMASNQGPQVGGFNPMDLLRQ